MAAATSGVEPSAAAAAAAVASTDPDTQVVVEARKSCVVCGSVQPADGKLLRCLHVMCRKCLKESISLHGSVKCLQCPELLTSSRVAGVDLADQLMDCCPLLYGGSSKITVGRCTSETEQPSLNCNACEENEDLSREATHVCNDCSGLPLCDQHAGKHLKARFSSSHQVTEVNSSKALVAQPRHRCLLHCQFDVNLYCQTCKQTLCQKCLDESHGGHAIGSASSAARQHLEETHKRLAKLSVEASQDSASAYHYYYYYHYYYGSLRWHWVPYMAASGSECLVAEHLGRVSKQIKQLENDGEVASKAITDTYNELERLSQSAKDRGVAEVDQLVWKYLNPLQQKRDELRQLMQKKAMIEDVLRSLSPDAADPLKVLSMLQLVDVNLDTLQKAVSRVESVSLSQKVTATAKAGGHLEAMVDSLVLLSVSTPVRPSVLPSSANAQADCIILQPPDSMSILFDLNGITDGITLQDTYASACQSRAENRGCAFALHGYRSGCQQWRLKVSNPVVKSLSGQTSYHMEAGVSQFRWEDDVDNRFSRESGLPLAFSYCYTLRSDGFTRSGEEIRLGLSLCTWGEGDILTFTLECAKGRLTCTNDRTQDTETLNGVDCTQHLFPVVFLPRSGMKATFY